MTSRAAAAEPDREPLEQWTLSRLRDLARQRDVPGRSRMTRAELVEALGDADHPAASRLESFRRLALARSRGEMVFLPRQLEGTERRNHVRQTIREDHRTRIAGADSGHDAQAKFDKLAGSLYSFFRGTCLLFYRDMAGEDAWMPTVLTLGDVHPENFGVMPSADDVPIFGVNDFDEAYYAPFTWDLKRGATGFVLAADEVGGHGPKRQAKIAAAFVEGYVEGIKGYARSRDELSHQMRQDNGPALVADLIADALEDREHWLGRKYHDEYRRGFRSDEEHVPVSSRVAEFQAALDTYVVDNDIDVPQDRTPGMRVKDVCMRLGQGTASLGLPRYYLLLEGPRGDGSDDVILELKQARRSALDGLAPPSPWVIGGHAERITHAQGVHLVRGDRFYGAAELDGLSFMVRERPLPRRDRPGRPVEEGVVRLRRHLRPEPGALPRAVRRVGARRRRRRAGDPRRDPARGPLRRRHGALRRRDRGAAAGRPRPLPRRSRPGRLHRHRPRLPLTPAALRPACRTLLPRCGAWTCCSPSSPW